MITLINLTPHDINFYAGDKLVAMYFSQGCARVSQKSQLIDTLEAGGVQIPINQVVYGDVQDLPDYKKGVYYIVSALVKTAAKRSDLLSPDDLVRDDKGRIIGCKAFAL